MTKKNAKNIKTANKLIKTIKQYTEALTDELDTAVIIQHTYAGDPNIAKLLKCEYNYNIPADHTEHTLRMTIAK